MILVVATRNPNKLREIRRIAHGLHLKLKSLSDFQSVPQVREDGSTLSANAVKKATVFCRALKIPVLADDSGLFVPRLKGRPGVHSARYAGPACDYARNNRKLLQAMRLLHGRGRRAYFATCVALAIPGQRVITRTAKVWGTIELQPQGEQGFGYDPIFCPRGTHLTFAQMSPRQKNRISHRALALAKMAEVVKGLSR